MSGVSYDADANTSVTDHTATPATYYYNQDERLSVRNLTDGTGVATNGYDYMAYGDKVDSMIDGGVEQRYTYTSRELNEVSGDYYFRNRSHSPYIGAFMQRDSLGYIEGMSAYAGYFARALSIDPSGNVTVAECTKAWDDDVALCKQLYPWHQDWKKRAQFMLCEAAAMAKYSACLAIASAEYVIVGTFDSLCAAGKWLKEHPEVVVGTVVVVAGVVMVVTTGPGGALVLVAL